jgi:phage tail sheath gpL-like
MPSVNFRGISVYSDQRENAEVVNNILQGKLNATASVTLTNSATSTAVTDFRVGAESVILFMPTTSDGASELAAGGMFVSARSKNTFTITHASASTTRSFDYVVIG